MNTEAGSAGIWRPVPDAAGSQRARAAAERVAGAHATGTVATGPSWMAANWGAPAHVHAWVTSRLGGVSQTPFDSFNLATHVGDRIHAVRVNRRLLRDQLPGIRRLQWLNQVHGTQVISVMPGQQILRTRTADAAAVFAPGDGAVVLTADCLPVFLTDTRGTVAAVAHAGWRGLAAGVLEATVSALLHARAGSAPTAEGLMAWFGPAIGPCHFEVGADVREAFLTAPSAVATRTALVASGVATSAAAVAEKIDAAFLPRADQPGKWLMDIYALARLHLQAAGVHRISGGGLCTVCDAEHCFSYRRDGVTGRMASLIYLESRP